MNRELDVSYPFPDALFISVKKKEWIDVRSTSILLEEREQVWLKEEIKKGRTTIEECMSHEIQSTHSQIDDDLSHGGLTVYRQRSARLLLKELPKHQMHARQRKGFVIPFLKMCANHKFVSVINEYAAKKCAEFNKDSVTFSQLWSNIMTHELIHVYELVREKAFPKEEFNRLNHGITRELFGFILTLARKED